MPLFSRTSLNLRDPANFYEFKKSFFFYLLTGCLPNGFIDTQSLKNHIKNNLNAEECAHLSKAIYSTTHADDVTLKISLHLLTQIAGFKYEVALGIVAGLFTGYLKFHESLESILIALARTSIVTTIGAAATVFVVTQVVAELALGRYQEFDKFMLDNDLHNRYFTDNYLPTPM